MLKTKDLRVHSTARYQELKHQTHSANLRNFQKFQMRLVTAQQNIMAPTENALFVVAKPKKS